MERHKFYQEGVHWERIKQLGCGSSGTTYCIRDTESSFWLALKEVIIIMNIHVEEGGGCSQNNSCMVIGQLSSCMDKFL